MIARSQIRIFALALLFVMTSSSVARADGLDPAYFIRFDVIEHSWTYICTVLTIIMVVNYLLNFAVIGVPAILRASVPAKRVALGLILLTILGQVADRLGSIAGLFLAMPLSALVSIFVSSSDRALSSPAFGYSVLASNLICSGFAVGGLALFFLRRRWSVAKSLSWKVAIAAALLTNPAWILFTKLPRS
jgi:hypothetical protein